MTISNRFKNTLYNLFDSSNTKYLDLPDSLSPKFPQPDSQAWPDFLL